MELETRVAMLEKAFAELKIRSLVPHGLQPIDATEDFDNLKLLLHSNLWPRAIDPKFICSKSVDEQKNDRAVRILDFSIETPLENVKFLDFGCGEGHVIKNSLKQKPAISVGFDIKKSDQWTADKPALFTTDWEEVKSNAPYDAVLMYDVIDHLEIGEKEVERREIVDILNKIKKVMNSNAKLYIHCHPWCSRHATHLYHKINKAFIHLVFTDEELKEMNLCTDVRMAYHVIHPEIYTTLFANAGLRINRKNIIEEQVEPFFRDVALVAKRIKRNWLGSPDRQLSSGKGFPTNPMRVQFADFVLN